MEKKSRLRGPNFTSSDNSLLRDIISKYKHIIENKKTDGANLLQKQKAWSNVMEEFNAISTDHHRTVESLQQNYKNLKKKAKKCASDVKMEIPDEPPPQQSTYASISMTPMTHVAQDDLSSYFTNNGAQKRKPHDLLTCNRKTQVPEKQSVSEKFKVLAATKIEFVATQKELLNIQLVEEEEKLEHNRLLRAMELEDAKAKYAHNERLRQLELEKFISNKQD